MAKRSEANQKIWDSGWFAHNAGIDREKCPFVPRSAARQLWIAGWRAAEHKRAEAKAAAMRSAAALQCGCRSCRQKNPSYSYDSDTKERVAVDVVAGVFVAGLWAAAALI